MNAPSGHLRPPDHDVILATANARYSHTSLALRSLVANLGPHRGRAAILEFTIEDRAEAIVEQILARGPAIVGLSVYLWNVRLLTHVAALLKRIRPDIRLVAGGPEVSFETADMPIAGHVDYIVAGEGERAFSTLVDRLLAGQTPENRRIEADAVDLDTLDLPHARYTDEDIAHRVIYVEASRGCPFGCEFCLSAVEKRVRRFPEAKVLEGLSSLWDRGARRFKFIDRSLHLAVSPALIDFFEARRHEPLFLHFELIPDRLPEWLAERLVGFPDGAVQLEAGIQTLNDEVARRIGRKQRIDVALDNLARLRRETGVHLHSDLVVGLPGEDAASFREGFDRLYALGLQEIQVGILKRLRGAPIARHDGPWEMLYNPEPPYDILQNRLIDFPAMQRLKRFAKFFDLVANRGHFRTFVPLLIGDASPFDRFMALSDWLFRKTGRAHAIALNRLAELLFAFVTENGGISPADAANRLRFDFTRAGRRRFPGSLDRHVTERPEASSGPSRSQLPARQQRHRR